MKKYFYLSVAALALVSCAEDDYMGNSEDLDTRKALSFNLSTPNLTRALSGADAAAALNNEFIVWGEKNEAAAPTTATEAKNLVFENYVVSWTANTAGTTNSNSSDWEYVGKENHAYDSNVTPNIGTGKSQSIKYWDYSASNYVFTAVSAKSSDLQDGHVVIAKTTSGASGAAKGYTVTVKDGASLANLYYSDRWASAPAQAVQQVDLTFRNFMSKIRFGMYETVPGYKVSIDNVYYNSSSSTSKFGVDGNFIVLGSNDTKYIITYDANNKVKVATEGTTNVKTYFEIASSVINAAEALGTSSSEATKEEYEAILPNTSNTTNMKLKVDYTLTSEDTGEEIKVTGATAEVPSNYCQWQSNFAYTYLFKISDNTNGTTGKDIVGLYPITFDAVVAEDGTTGEQETITSVTNPSITTYASGKVVTVNNEYTAGTVYFMNDTKNVADYKVYEVQNYGTIETVTTEEVVANWANNYLIFTEVSTTDVTEIPLSDGTNISATTNQAKSFTAAAGKTYVIANNALASATTYKVVKVTGTETAPTYAWTTQDDGGNAIDHEFNAVDETCSFSLVSNSPADNSPVINAKRFVKIVDSASRDVTSNFAISETSSGVFSITLGAAAIAAGNATYTVKFSDKASTSLVVNLTYVLSATSVTAVKAGSTATFTLSAKKADDSTTPVSGAVAKNLPAGVTVADVAGTYTVTADATAVAGQYAVTVAGQSLTINVDSYAFDGNVALVKSASDPQPTANLTLKKTSYATGSMVVETAAVGYGNLSGVDATIATVTGDAGVFTFTPVNAGTYTVTYENATATVTVTE